MNFQAAKAKGNDELTFWAQSIRNHFWQCAKTCENDAKNLKASLEYHIPYGQE